MKELDIYVIEEADELCQHYRPFCAYTDFDKAVDACDEMNKYNEELERDYLKLENEHGIDYDRTNEKIFNNYLKGENPKLLELVEKINVFEGDLSSEDYATLEVYADAFDSFLNLGEEAYRKSATECGYSEEVIHLLLRGLEYNKNTCREYYYVSSHPIKLYVSDEQ